MKACNVELAASRGRREGCSGIPRGWAGEKEVFVESQACDLVPPTEECRGREEKRKGRRKDAFTLQECLAAGASTSYSSGRVKSEVDAAPSTKK